MYDYIKGELTYKIQNSKGCFATVETGGVGYNFEITERDFDNLENEKEIKLYSVLLHREDKMSLCGFLKREERDIFIVLTSVSGVGAKMALTLLNSFNIADLIGFVLDGNYKELTKAKGVGPKLAQKIILELKDKLNSYQNLPLQKSSSNSKIDTPNVEDAQMVLTSLGYDKSEISNAIERALQTLDTNASAEDILRKSLQILSA